MGRQREGIYALGRSLLEPDAAPVTALQGGPGSGCSYVLGAVTGLVHRYEGKVLRGRALDGHRPSMAGAIISAVIGVDGQFEARRRHVLAAVQGWQDGSSTPAAVVEPLADLLCRQAGDRVGVLVLDDVHPGEPATDQVMQLFADLPQAQDGRLRVLCGLSVPPDPSAEWRWPTENVRPLSGDEIDGLVLQRLGHRPTDHLVRWLLAASGGNPSLVQTAVDSSRASGHLRLMDDRAVLGPAPEPLPMVADHPVLIGLDRLGAEPAALARACAVLGPLGLDQACQVLGTDQQSVRRARVVLQRSGIVGGRGWPTSGNGRPADGPPGAVRGRCAISVELARQLIAASVSPSQQREWRGGSLLDGADGGVGAQSGRALAHAPAWARQPAEVVRPAGAGQPVRLSEGVSAEPAPTELVADLLRSGRFADLLCLAERLVDEEPDQAAATELLGLAVALVDLPAEEAGQQADQCRPTADPTTVGGLAANCLNALNSGDRARARRFAGQHDDLVESGGAPPDWPVVDLAAQCRLWLGDPAVTHSDPTGTPSGNDSPTDRSVADQADPGDRPLVADLLSAFDRGEWDQALEAIHLFTCGHQRPQAWLPPLSVPGVAALLWCRRGRLDRMRVWAEHDPDALHTNLALAEGSWLTGEPAAAVVRLRPWLDDRIARAGGSGLESLLCLLAEAASACDEPDVARQSVELLRQRVINDPDAASSSAFADRAAAVVAGDHGRAMASAASFARLGRPFDQARSLLAAAGLGADPGMSALPAQRLMVRIGAPAWSRRAEVAHRVGREFGRRAPGPPVDDIDLATLVAEGLSNRQAAAWAGLSVRTVEARLSALFTRAGCTSRTALAALHVEHGRRGLAQLLAA